MCIPACTGADTPLGRHPQGRHPLGRHPLADTPSLDRHPWQTQTPLGRYPPGRHPQADTPPWADPASPWVDTSGHTHPWADILGTPLGINPPGQTSLVHILLECFLVYELFLQDRGRGVMSPRPPGSATGCFQSA